MAYSKRVLILSEVEQEVFYGNPLLTNNDQRYFFAQLPATAVAEVLRMVGRDTGFIECFRHVLGAQSKSRVYEQDLLAMLVGNATKQGTYGIAQISDRSYEHLLTRSVLCGTGTRFNASSCLSRGEKQHRHF